MYEWPPKSNNIFLIKKGHFYLFVGIIPSSIVAQHLLDQFNLIFQSLYQIDLYKWTVVETTSLGIGV